MNSSTNSSSSSAYDPLVITQPTGRDNEVRFLTEQMKRLGIRHNWEATATMMEQLKAENHRLSQERDYLLNQVQTLQTEKEKIFVDANEYGKRFVKDLEDKHNAQIQKLKDKHFQEVKKQQERHEEHVDNLHNRSQLFQVRREDEEVQSLVQKLLPTSNITDAVFQTCVNKQEAAQHREAFTKKELEAVERKLRSRTAKRVAWETVVNMIKPDYQSSLEIEQQKNELRDMERQIRKKKQRLTAMSFMSRFEPDNLGLSPTTTASSTPVVSSTSTPKTPKTSNTLRSLPDQRVETPTLKKVVDVVSDDEEDNNEDFYGNYDYEDKEHMSIDNSQVPTRGSKQQQFAFNFAGK